MRTEPWEIIQLFLLHKTQSVELVTLSLRVILIIRNMTFKQSNVDHQVVFVCQFLSAPHWMSLRVNLIVRNATRDSNSLWLSTVASAYETFPWWWHCRYFVYLKDHILQSKTICNFMRRISSAFHFCSSKNNSHWFRIFLIFFCSPNWITNSVLWPLCCDPTY